MHGFSDQAGRFATTRESRDHELVNIDRSIAEKRSLVVPVAVALLVKGDRDGALAAMRALYAEQYELVTGIRPPLEVVR